MKQKYNSFRSSILPANIALSLGLALVGISSQLAHAATTTISWANPANVSSSAVTSTATSANITVPAGTWAVGDVIYFYGTTATTNPFSTTATRYYVVSVVGTTIQVSATPGGAALAAINTTTTSTIGQGLDWFTGANWTGGVVPNSNSTIANLGTNINNSPTSLPVVVNGAATVYGLTFGGSANGDLTLVSGANGTGLYSLTFATNDSSTPKMTMSGGSNGIIALGTSSNGSMTLKIAGTQGLIFNSSTGGALTGSGNGATSTAPGKQIRLANVDWSGFSGGIQVERGFIQLQATGQLPNQTLTIGNAQTITNNTLAGLSMNSQTATVDALNGNSLGRIWGSGTLTVGNANGTGDFGGVIGKDFTGATTATNLAKAGTGTQTISGIMAGTGTVTINTNGGTLVLNSANSYTGATVVSSGGTIRLGNGSALGSTASTTINSGGTLDLGGQTITNIISVSGSGVSSAGALINSNTGAAASLNSEITNGASFTVGGAGDMTIQRARSGGGVFILTKTGTGTLTLGNASTTTHMNLMAVDVTSASTVNFNTVSGTNYLVADRGVRISAGGTVKYTGTGTNMVGDNQEVIVSNGTFNMNGISDTVGQLTIGDGTNNGTISGGSASTMTVGGSYQAFAAGGSSLSGGIEAMSGSVDVKLAGAVALNKTTAGTITLTQANSFSGGTAIKAGTITQTIAGALSTGTITLGDGSSSTSATLIGNASGAVTNTNAVTIASGGSGTYTIKNTSNSDYNFSGAIALNNAATFATTADGAMFLSGQITGSSLITIDGGGATTKFVSLNTSSAGTFSGNILVQNHGQLKFGNSASNALSTSTTLTLDATSSMDTGLLSQTFAGVNDVSTGAGGSTIINAQSGTNLTLGGSGSYSYSGAISGNGGLIKSGGGAQTLAGTNTYGGATAVNGGTLKVTGSIGSSAVTVSNSGTVLASGTTGTVGQSVTVNTGAVLDAGGVNAIGTATVGSGGTTMNSGSIFSWDVSSDGASYDKLITSSAAGSSAVFKVVLADNTQSDSFWNITEHWTNILTTNGTSAVSSWANIFSSIEVVDSTGATVDTSVKGYFTASGNTLTWTAVPEPTSALAGLLLGAGLLRRRRSA